MDKKSVNTCATMQINEKDMKGIETIKPLEIETANKDEKPAKPSRDEKHFYKKYIGKNKYEFEGKMVEGGMGAIYKVLDGSLMRNSAMKVILPEHKKNSSTLKDFITEAKITGLLEHPNITPVHDLGFSKESGLYFTMKLINGEPLVDIIYGLKEGNPIYSRYDLYTRLTIFRKVLDAIAFAHSKNIIHRDIKPHNIMIGEFGEVLLMDWGLAKFSAVKYDKQNHNNSKTIDDNLSYAFIESLPGSLLEPDGTIKGSPAYLAPEQARGEPKEIDKRTDIFLLGATLYHIVALDVPYKGEDVMSVVKKAEHRDLIPPDERAPDLQIPNELCKIIMKSMEKEKEDRYQSVEEMIRDIDNILLGKWATFDKEVFKKGETIIKEGEKGDKAYYILKGSVTVTKKISGKEVELANLTAGSIFGEMSIITEEERSATVIANEDIELAILTKNTLERSLEKLPPYVNEIIKSITERLFEANERINPNTQ